MIKKVGKLITTDKDPKVYCTQNYASTVSKTSSYIFQKLSGPSFSGAAISGRVFSCLAFLRLTSWSVTFRS